jgi:hypothetical protein
MATDPWAGTEFAAPAESDPWAGTEFSAAPETPAAPAPREEGSFGKDMAMAFGRGSNMLLDGLGTLYGLATNDYDNWAKRQAASGMEYYDRGKSQEMVEQEQARARAVQAADGEWSKMGAFLWETVTNKRLLAATLTEQIPMLAAPGGAGAAAGRGAVMLGAGKKLAGRIGTGAGIGVGGALNAADSADTALEELLKLPPDVWAQNAEYAGMVADGVDPEIAKAQIAKKLARDSAAVSFLISLVSQKVVPNGAAFEKATGRGSSGLTGNLGERFVKGVVGETLQEVTEEVGAQGAANFNIGRVDPSQPLTEGFGESAAGAIVAAGPMGGTVAALTPGQAEQETVPDDEAAAAVRALQEEAAEAEAGEQELAAVERSRAKAAEADQAASRAAYEVEAAGGDSLDVLNAATNAYNEVESRQREQAAAERELDALRNPELRDPATAEERELDGAERDRDPLTEAVADARARGDENSALRLENAQRMRRTAAQFEAQGRVEQARNFRTKADKIVTDILGPQALSGGAVQTTAQTGQLIPAEQVRPTVAPRPPETIDGVAVDVTDPRLPNSNTIYGQEPPDVTARRERFAQSSPVAMEGVIEPGQPGREAQPLQPFGSELPAEQITYPEQGTTEEIADADYASPVMDSARQEYELQRTLAPLKGLTVDEEVEDEDGNVVRVSRPLDVEVRQRQKRAQVMDSLLECLL